MPPLTVAAAVPLQSPLQLRVNVDGAIDTVNTPGCVIVTVPDDGHPFASVNVNV